MLYRLAIRLAAPFHAKARRFVKGRQGLLQRIAEALEPDTRPRVWMHCASLGEFEQGRPVLEAIRERFPGYSLVLTFFSPSGYEAKKTYAGADHIFYLPVDSRRHAQQFLDLVQPRCALFVKYEFWYHYLDTLRRRQIPTLLFSALFQPRHPFFKWYGGLYREMLRSYRHIFVQDEASRRLLEQIGISQVTVAGDTRFDRAAGVLSQDKSFRSIEVFREGHTLLVAGSTWPGDEQLLAQAFRQLPGYYKLLIAPHEVDEAHISRLLALFPGSCLWASDEDTYRSSRVCIVHTVGQLAYLYKYADATWIGGGFTRSGIHNVVEPAVFGSPVFFGPVYDRYQEAVEMIQRNAAASVSDARELVAALDNKEALLRMGSNAQEYVQQKLGATKAVMGYLAEKCLPSIA